MIKTINFKMKWDIHLMRKERGERVKVRVRQINIWNY
jgi:hypothetical protein